MNGKSSINNKNKLDLQAVNLTKDDHSLLYLAKDWEWKPKGLTTS